MNANGVTDIAEIIVLPGNISHVTIRKGAEVSLESAERLIKTLETLSNQNIPYRGGMFDITNVTYIHEDAPEPQRGPQRFDMSQRASTAKR